MSDPDICTHCASYWRAGHTEACPMATGIYPVGPNEAGIICASCDEPLGDSYMVPNNVIICVGCAARDLMEEA